MGESTEYFTYRLTNLPKSLKQEDIYQLFCPDDQKAIAGTSLGPCPYQPTAFNVATVTFHGQRNLKKGMTPGEGPLKCYHKSDCETVRVDDTFYGLTPLNAVAGTPKAEYGIHLFILTIAKLPLKFLASLLSLV